MKITHYSNSFISVRSQGEHILCDPWMGKANTGGWQSFPEYPTEELACHLLDARWIYLSHLHDDHFHPETLKVLGLLDREFVIKRFDAPVMRERLKKIGAKRIHELDPFTINRFGPFDVAIFPQMTSNSSAYEDQVNFDMDTSIAFRADGTVFFNQVDNPLSTADAKEVRDWIVNHLGAIDIACLKSGAASEYPHLFLDIDKIKEKQRLVDGALDLLTTWLRLLDPKFFFPAGGTYVIPGWMHVLGDNIAQPTFNDICELIGKLNLPLKPLSLEGGYTVDMSTKDPHIKIEQAVEPIETNMQAAIRMHSTDSYEYEVLIPPPYVEILEMLGSARENWLRKVHSADFKISQSIRFEIYEGLKMIDDRPDLTRRLGSYQLFESSSEHSGTLIIHIDHRALVGCLTRRFIWNGVLGALCLFERRPNQHHPTDMFSLNYLAM